MKLWNPTTGHMMGSFECKAMPTDVARILDGAALVAVDIEGKLYTFDASRAMKRYGSELAR